LTLPLFVLADIQAHVTSGAIDLIFSDSRWRTLTELLGPTRRETSKAIVQRLVPGDFAKRFAPKDGFQEGIEIADVYAIMANTDGTADDADIAFYVKFGYDGPVCDYTRKVVMSVHPTRSIVLADRRRLVTTAELEDRFFFEDEFNARS
jgi:hypothetical protein